MSTKLLLLFGNAVTIDSSVLDLTTTGLKLIGTQNYSTDFCAFLLQLSAKSVTGLVSSPTVSVGTIAAGYTDIYSSIPFDSINATANFQNLNIANGAGIPNGTHIYLNVTVAAVATTYTVEIGLAGFLQ